MSVYVDDMRAGYGRMVMCHMIANSGFEPRSVRPWVIELWKRLPLVAWRYAYDETAERADVLRVTAMLDDAGIPRRRSHIYCLAGNEPLEQCEARVRDINQWGAKAIVQRRRPLDWMGGPLPCLHDWDEQKLIDFQRWGTRLSKSKDAAGNLLLDIDHTGGNGDNVRPVSRPVSTQTTKARTCLVETTIYEYETPATERSAGRPGVAEGAPLPALDSARLRSGPGIHGSEAAHRRDAVGPSDEPRAGSRASAGVEPDVLCGRSAQEHRIAGAGDDAPLHPDVDAAREAAAGLQRRSGRTSRNHLPRRRLGELRADEARERLRMAQPPEPQERSGDTQAALGAEPVNGFILPHRMFDQGAPDSLDRPLRTLVGKNGRQVRVCQPVLIPFFGERDGQAPRAHSVDEPLPTVTGHGAGAVAEAFIIDLNHGIKPSEHPQAEAARRVQSVDRPLPTVTTNRGKGLVEAEANPYLVKYNSTGSAYSVEDPIQTISTKDRYALVTTARGTFAIDIRLRMLKTHELAAAHSVRGYILKGKSEEQVKQIGNMVPAQTARALCRSVLV